MLDLALLAANATQLKYILAHWDDNGSQIFAFYMVIASIVLQVNISEYRNASARARAGHSESAHFIASCCSHTGAHARTHTKARACENFDNYLMRAHCLHFRAMFMHAAHRFCRRLFVLCLH